MKTFFYKTRTSLFLLFICIGFIFSAKATIYPISLTYSGTNEVPPNASTATGTFVGTYDDATNTISYTITFSGLSSNTVAAHFHAPAPPGVAVAPILTHVGFPLGVTAGVYVKVDVLTNLLESQLLAGLVYSNIHTTLLPGGELRTQIFLGAPFTAPTITCPTNITVSNDANLCSASVSFAATNITGNPAPTVTYNIGATVITSPHIFPVGTTTVNAMALSGGGVATCSFTVTVNDVEDPVVSNMSATPNTLWPPNHKLKDVTVNYTSTDNCAVVSCVLTVSSDEPVNSWGDGNTSPDWVIVDDHHVKLRAERSGKGDGRVYTITATCVDAAGNTGSNTTTVTVAHDQGNVSARTMIYGADQSPRALSVIATPNPSRNYFTLHIETDNNKDKMSIRVSDVMGRIVETRNNLSGNQTLRFGNNLKAGIYFVELRQGNETQYMKLLKQ